MALHRQKAYYTIGEVADMLDVKQHVIRYWESEFSQLRPRKNKNRNRQYSVSQVNILKTIKQMLHEERYTIEGAKRKLNERKRTKKKTSKNSDLQKMLTRLKELKVKFDQEFNIKKDI